MKAFLAFLVVVATGFAHEIDRQFPVPDTNIMGLAYGGGYLWAVSANQTGYTGDYSWYKIDPSSGDVLQTFLFTEFVGTPAGMAYMDYNDSPCVWIMDRNEGADYFRARAFDAVTGEYRVMVNPFYIPGSYMNDHICGLCSDGENLVVAGHRFTQGWTVADRFTQAGAFVNRVLTIEYFLMPFYDIAYSTWAGETVVWYSTDQWVKAYNTAGVVVHTVTTTGVKGLAAESENYLWAATDSYIYRLADWSTGLSRTTWGSLKAGLGEAFGCEPVSSVPLDRRVP